VGIQIGPALEGFLVIKKKYKHLSVKWTGFTRKGSGKIKDWKIRPNMAKQLFEREGHGKFDKSLVSE